MLAITAPALTPPQACPWAPDPRNPTDQPDAQPHLASASPSTTAKKPRGNPNLALAPRCGARTRAGCPCRAPAIRGKLRCRMHGGRSTGPRTPEGLARLRAARTIHGRYGAEVRTRQHYVHSVLRRGRMAVAALALLPFERFIQLGPIPPALNPPPPNSGGLSRAEERTTLRAQAEAHAPWKLAIATAKAAKRCAAATKSGEPAIAANAPAKAHAPEPPHAAVTTSCKAVAEPLAPEASPAITAASRDTVAGLPTGSVPGGRRSGTGPEGPHAPERTERRHPAEPPMPRGAVAPGAPSLPTGPVPGGRLSGIPPAKPHAPVPQSPLANRAAIVPRAQPAGMRQRLLTSTSRGTPAMLPTWAGGAIG